MVIKPLPPKNPRPSPPWVKNDYTLTQDRECASCNKLCAMSNMHQWEYKYYCPNEECWPEEYYRLYFHHDMNLL